MTRRCPRCQQPFRCRPDAIAACACHHLALPAHALRRIRTYTERQFGGYVCLCVHCLAELAGTLPAEFINQPPAV